MRARRRNGHHQGEPVRWPIRDAAFAKSKGGMNIKSDCRGAGMCESGVMDAGNGKHFKCDRRAFLRLGAALAVGVPLAPWSRAAGPSAAPSPARGKAAVAIVSCKTYGAEVKPALRQCFDLIGGIDRLVRNKT